MLIFQTTYFKDQLKITKTSSFITFIIYGVQVDEYTTFE
jgi:hypothetical protein